MYQSTSYIIAADIRQKPFSGMYINVSDPIYSFRHVKIDGKNLLLVGGGNHKTGYSTSYNETYKTLENKLKSIYPNAEVLYRWNTRDCMTLDKIPYIGRYSNIIENMYIGTGFNKWGMTTSNVAANIIKDMILKKENKYAYVFDSTRIKPIKNRKELKNIIVQSVDSLFIDKIKNSTIYQLIKKLNVPVIYTTNYDDTIERYYKMQSEALNVVESLEELRLADCSKTRLMKYHGTIKNDKSIVLSESQYFERMDFSSFLDKQLQKDWKDYSILYLGYSMSDINIKLLLYRLNKESGGKDIQSYIFTTKPNDIQDRVFENNNIIILTYIKTYVKIFMRRCKNDKYKCYKFQKRYIHIIRANYKFGGQINGFYFKQKT